MSETEEQPTQPASPVKAPNASAFPGAFDLFMPSIEIIKRNPVSFLVLLGIPALIVLVAGSVPPTSENIGLVSLLGLIGGIAALLTTPGVVLLELKGAHKEQPGYKEAFLQGLKYFWRLVGLAICMIVIFAVAFILLIVPFFFALRRYVLAPYYLIDRDLGVFAALKASAEESKQYSGPIWGLIGVTVLLSLTNVIPVIGMVAATVLTALYGPAAALRYLQVKSAINGKTPVTPIELDLKATPKAA